MSLFSCPLRQSQFLGAGSACLPFIALLALDGINARLPHLALQFLLLFRLTPITHYFPPPTIPPIVHDRAATGIGVHSDYVPVSCKIFRWQIGSRTAEPWNRVDYKSVANECSEHG